MKAHLSTEFFTFFKKLAANNHKEWFDANRKWYEEAVKAPFDALISDLLREMEKKDKAYRQVAAKDCIFRINRDIRFSKDKTPYKTNRSAIISLGGRKDMGPSGFYLELGPETCAIYAGVYMPDKNEVAAIRHHIAKNAKQFEEIVYNKAFKKTFGKVRGEAQKRIDAELKEAADKLPVIYQKQFYIMHDFPEKTATGKDLVSHILTTVDHAADYMKFMQKAMSKVAKS